MAIQNKGVLEAEMKKSFIKRFKEGYMKSSKKLKIALPTLVLLLMIGATSAAWLLLHTTSPTGFSIYSSEPLTFQSNFTFTSIDTTNSSVFKSELINITNVDGLIDLNVTITEVVEDIIGDGCINDNDCSYTATYDMLVLNESTIISVPNGDYFIELNTTCVRFACPQNYSTTVDITQA